jgi:DNA-binding MarR family transcriptional regulator
MELARRLTTSASGVTRQVLPLERMGLVEREPGHWPLRDDGSVELP